MHRVASILRDLIVPQGFVELPSGTTKEQALTILGRRACEAAGVGAGRVEEVLRGLLDREGIISTGIGIGIAVPHIRHSAVARDTIRVGRAGRGIDFDSLDRNPAHLIFLILLPPGEHRRHLQIVSAIVGALRPESRRAYVISSPDGTTFVERFFARDGT
jgi:mannitol/fructose-specific phosphotransferase system IIA component (Ntr-type)